MKIKVIFSPLSIVKSMKSSAIISLLNELCHKLHSNRHLSSSSIVRSMILRFTLNNRALFHNFYYFNCFQFALSMKIWSNRMRIISTDYDPRKKNTHFTMTCNYCLLSVIIYNDDIRFSSISVHMALHCHSHSSANLRAKMIATKLLRWKWKFSHFAYMWWVSKSLSGYIQYTSFDRFDCTIQFITGFAVISSPFRWVFFSLVYSPPVVFSSEPASNGLNEQCSTILNEKLLLNKLINCARSTHTHTQKINITVRLVSIGNPFAFTSFSTTTELMENIQWDAVP